MNRPTKIITHTAVSRRHHTVKDVDRWHMVRWPFFRSRAGFWVGYHYVIEWDGTITQTRGHYEEGAHCIGQNTSSIGVCFMGNGDAHEPSKYQLDAWKRLYQRIKAEFPHITVNDIYPHRKWANKTCHGSKLSDTYYADQLPERRKKRIKDQIRTLQAMLNRLLALIADKRMHSNELR